jgi:hypothetical protein
MVSGISVGFSQDGRPQQLQPAAANGVNINNTNAAIVENPSKTPVQEMHRTVLSNACPVRKPIVARAKIVGQANGDNAMERMSQHTV